MADISVTAASVVPPTDNPQYFRGIAGATITAGQLLYKDASDSNKLKLAVDTNASTAEVVGVAMCGGGAGQPIDYIASGDYTVGGTVAVGTVYGIGDNAGGIAPVSDNGAGDYVTVIGVGISTSKIRLGIIPSRVAHA